MTTRSQFISQNAISYIADFTKIRISIHNRDYDYYKKFWYCQLYRM